MLAVLMKNWAPPLLGRPVFAIDRVPGSLDRRRATKNSNWVPLSIKMGSRVVEGSGTSAN